MARASQVQEEIAKAFKVMNTTFTVSAELVEKDKLIEAVLKVLERDPRFTKIEERNVKRILRKLELEDLTYLANVFDVFGEWLDQALKQAANQVSA